MLRKLTLTTQHRTGDDAGRRGDADEGSGGVEVQVGWAELLVGTVRSAGIAAVRGCSDGLCRYACVIAVALSLSMLRGRALAE